MADTNAKTYLRLPPPSPGVHLRPPSFLLPIYQDVVLFWGEDHVLRKVRAPVELAQDRERVAHVQDMLLAANPLGTTDEGRTGRE